MSQQLIIPATQPTFNLQDLVEVVKLSQGLDSVDITHTNTYKITFNHRPKNRRDGRPRPRGNIDFHMEDVDYGHAPPQIFQRAHHGNPLNNRPLMSSASDVIFVMVRTQRKLAGKVLEIIRHQDYKTWFFWRFLSKGFVKKIVWTAKAQKKVWSAKENEELQSHGMVHSQQILPPLPFSSAATFANIMCRQPLPPSLSPSSAKLMIMALEEYGYQSRR
ncbi:hypothetical protein Tco_0373378 [Tanacetum coccineum]